MTRIIRSWGGKRKKGKMRPGARTRARRTGKGGSTELPTWKTDSRLACQWTDDILIKMTFHISYQRQWKSLARREERGRPSLFGGGRQARLDEACTNTIARNERKYGSWWHWWEYEGRERSRSRKYSFEQARFSLRLQHNGTRRYGHFSRSKTRMI